MSLLQKTLKKPVIVSGIGVHSGHKANLVIRPARPNTGIVFVRTDLPDTPQIAADYRNVISTQMATTLGRGKISISTVEHIMAALYGCGVDNAILEVDGPEVPILDGSSIGFCEAIESVGVESQLQVRPELHLKKKVELKVGDKWAVAEPSDRFELDVSIEWDHSIIGYQKFLFEEEKTSFEQVAGARTFGFLRDLDHMKAMGLARGGSLDNAIVLDHEAVLNPEGLRCPDEFVKHKVLDALGDFKLAGLPIRARFRLHRPGHDLHYRILMALFSDVSNYEIVTMSPEEARRRELQIGLEVDSEMIPAAARIAAY